MTPSPAAEPIPPASIPDSNFSTELRLLLERADGGEMTMEQIENALPESTMYGMLMVLFALPFSLPVSIPGISTPFGLAIMGMGVCLIAGVHPRMPRRAKAVNIEFSRLKRIVEKGIWLSQKLERFIRRGRLAFLVDSKFSRRFIGAMVVSSGFYLALPLPIPLTNTIPAYSLIFLAIGWMEGDGLLIVLGYVLGVAAWLYVIGLWLAGSAMATGLWTKLFG
jgi:hypothetical protein